MQLADRRSTKYVKAVKRAIISMGHATNADIVKALRKEFPDLSATTVHRVTQRLYEDSELRRAPKTLDGSIRYDSNISAHDHFMCNLCGKVRDVSLPQACRSIIQCNLSDCTISGPLTVSGVCKLCSEEWIGK
jgi:Fur family transcriptional regulator, peroxide stress response regulator